jgi:DNA (cytosine-5)-methyltransferase 1
VKDSQIEQFEPANPAGTVAELFAGVGGFRLGLAAANLKTVFSNQWEPATKSQLASEVYVNRFGSTGHSNEDIAKVTTIEPDFDLLVGGFPCQDYSVAKSLNSSKGLEGKKGVLWWEILRLVRLKKPNFIFLENVDRLLKSPSSQRGRDFAIMLKSLGDEGYTIEWRVVSASEYGFPQRRIRVFIVAYKTDRFPNRQNPIEIIGKTGILARALPVNLLADSVDQIRLDDALDVITEHFNKGGKKSPFENAGVFIGDIAYTTKTVTDSNLVEKFLTLGDVVLPDHEVDESFFISGERLEEWEYLKGAKSIPRKHASGATYNYTEGKMAFPDSLERPSRTILTGEGGTSWKSMRSSGVASIICIANLCE